jgi:hypothetical protein
VPDTFKTPFSLFIMLSFSEIGSGLLLMPVCDIAMFKEVIYKINEKNLMTKFKFKLNSMKHSVHS